MKNKKRALLSTISVVSLICFFTPWMQFVSSSAQRAQSFVFELGIIHPGWLKIEHNTVGGAAVVNGMSGSTSFESGTFIQMSWSWLFLLVFFVARRFMPAKPAAK